MRARMLWIPLLVGLSLTGCAVRATYVRPYRHTRVDVIGVAPYGYVGYSYNSCDRR